LRKRLEFFRPKSLLSFNVIKMAFLFKWLTIIGLLNGTIDRYIVKKSESAEVDTKYGITKLASTVLKDDTGEILLDLWGDQIQMVEVGDLIRIEDAYIQVYEGKATLNVRKPGKTLVLSSSKDRSMDPKSPDQSIGSMVGWIKLYLLFSKLCFLQRDRIDDLPRNQF